MMTKTKQIEQVTQIAPRLFLKMVWALQVSYDTLTDPYLGEDDGERQEPSINLLESVLSELRVDETAVDLVDQAVNQIMQELHKNLQRRKGVTD